MLRRKQHDVFRVFLNDMLLNTGVTMLALLAEDMEAVIHAALSITEGIPLLETECIAREREPGDGSPQRTVAEKIEAAL